MRHYHMEMCDSVVSRRLRLLLSHLVSSLSSLKMFPKDREEGDTGGLGGACVFAMGSLY